MSPPPPERPVIGRSACRREAAVCPTPERKKPRSRAVKDAGPRHPAQRARTLLDFVDQALAPEALMVRTEKR
jgi:hypothetical protein